MRTPSTREHLNAPPPAKSAFDAAAAAALYRGGRSYAEIAQRFDCCRTTVARRLARRGVKARPPGRPKGTRLSALAREIAGDLEGALGGAASVPALIDWLGETRARVMAALDELSARDLVTEVEGVYALAQTRRAPAQIRGGAR